MDNYFLPSLQPPQSKHCRGALWDRRHGNQVQQLIDVENGTMIWDESSWQHPMFLHCCVHKYYLYLLNVLIYLLFVTFNVITSNIKNGSIRGVGPRVTSPKILEGIWKKFLLNWFRSNFRRNPGILEGNLEGILEGIEGNSHSWYISSSSSFNLK